MLVLGAALFLFLGTFGIESDGLILGNDVVPYARDLASGAPSGAWNPHHLLFHPLAAAVAKVWGAVSDRGPSLALGLEAQRFVSALGGACAVLVVFRFATRLCGRAVALALAATFALSAGTWLYASVGETYLPAAAAVGALLATAAEARLSLRPADPLRIGAWLLLAVLLRQDSVLVVPALLLLLPRRTWLLAVVGAGAVSVAAYAVAWRLSGTELGLPAWLRGLADTGLFGRGIDAQGLAVSFGLLLASFSFGTFYFATWWKLALGLAAAALLIGVALPPFPRRPGGRAVAAGLAAFVLLRFLFVTWWQPANLEYHAASVLPLVLLVALSWHPTRAGRRRALRAAGLVACLVLVGVGNLFLLVLPCRSTALAEHASEAIDSARPEGLVVSIDRLFHYALLREEPEAVRLLDASDAVHGISDAALPATRAAIDATLRADGEVLVARDVVLPAFWGFEAVVPTQGLQALVEGYAATPIEDDEGRVWAFRLGTRP